MATKRPQPTEIPKELQHITARFSWCPETESNRRHEDFQSDKAKQHKRAFYLHFLIKPASYSLPDFSAFSVSFSLLGPLRLRYGYAGVACITPARGTMKPDGIKSLVDRRLLELHEFLKKTRGLLFFPSPSEGLFVIRRYSSNIFFY